MDSEDIGLKIKFIRQTKGLTQKQLAEKIGTSWEMISRYETGKSSSLNKIESISQALNTPLSSFLTSETLRDSELRYEMPNKVPFISNNITDLKQSLKKTKIYYTCPDWVFQQFPDSFAIKCDTLQISSTKIDRSGIVYATQENIPGEELLVLVNAPQKGLLVTSKKNVPSKSQIIATIIAWEKSLI